jgi:DNA repair exonuclease SbcCD ATPase subunit
VDDNNDSNDSDNVGSDTEVDDTDLITELKNEIERLKGALKAVEIEKTHTDVESAVPSNFDFADETKSFLKEYAEIEFEKKELQERMRNIKKEYEDQGVHTKEAVKAWKEYQKQLKETPEEAQEVEAIKSMINSDDTLASSATALID